MAFTYDFRGYGKSSGKKGYSKLDVDLLAALDFVRKRKPNRIVLIGGSMGAMASAKVAASQSVDGVVIMSGYYGSTTFVGPTEDDIKAIKAPLLFITSEEDSSYANMRSMYKLATSEKAERIFPGSGHGRAICYGQYASDCQQLIFDFLDEVAPLK
jgi:pimeloyl-ACP methyl ester carboxylesterase